MLFLDEPTSGLDSHTANEVMKVVQGLVADGTTIAATIHSPTAATFALFDRVMLLVRETASADTATPAIHCSRPDVGKLLFSLTKCVTGQSTTTPAHIGRRPETFGYLFASGTLCYRTRLLQQSGSRLFR